jgi:hypothetical protein
MGEPIIELPSTVDQRLEEVPTMLIRFTCKCNAAEII